jgi:hypothetical protein
MPSVHPLMQRWLIFLATIAGPILVPSGVSAHEMRANGGSVVVDAIVRGGSVSPAAKPAASDLGWGAPIFGQVDSAEAPRCFELGNDASTFHLSRPRVFEPLASHCRAKSLHAGTAEAHTRVRVTRLYNGSILCCRAVPPAHVVALPPDTNDDTASDGDERSDDDDSQDDQSADQDQDDGSETVAWLQAAFPYAVTFEYTTGASWIIPAVSPLMTFKPLRC